MGVFMIISNNSKEISKIVSSWVVSQKDLSDKLGISSAAMSRFFSSVTAIPLNRFLQIVHILKPPKAEVEEVFGLYLDDLGISRNDMALIFRGYHEDSVTEGPKERLHRLIDFLNDEQHIALVNVVQLMVQNN